MLSKKKKKIGLILLPPLHSDLPKLQSLVSSMESRPDAVSSVESWVPRFLRFVEENFDPRPPGETAADEEDSFRRRLTQFLFSPGGAVFMKKFVFSGELRCGQPAPDVLVRKTMCIPTYVSSLLIKM